MLNRNIDFKFKGSYADLYELSMQKTSFIERDGEEFAKFGITLEKVEALKNLMQEFVSCEKDEQLMVRQREISLAKADVSDNLRVALRKLISSIELSFPISEMEYQKCL